MRTSRFMTLLCSALIGHSALADTALTLEQAIDYAVQNNPGLQIMQERIAEAEAQLGQAVAAFYPQIKADLAYQHTDNPAQAFAMIIAQRRLDFTGSDFNHPGGTDNYRPEVTTSYSLFRGGQDYFQKQAAERSLEASVLEQSATRNRLVSDVSSAFYGYLAALESHRIAKRSIDSLQSELQQSRARYDVGTLLKADVLSLEVQLADAQAGEISAQHAIELAHSMLKTLLGMADQETLAIDQHSNWQLPTWPASFENLLQQAVSQHPELQAAEKAVAIAAEQVNAAQGAHLPRADAFVSYGADSKNLDFSGNRDNVTAGVKVEVDLFSGFATSEKIKQAEHRLTAAQHAARQTRLRIENQVKSARLKLEDALARTEVSRAAVRAAEEALRLVNEQRSAGTATVTRYLEAEVGRDKAASGQLTAQFDALRAQTELSQALGTWK